MSSASKKAHTALRGQAAVVTGAGSGLGRELSVRLSAAGVRLGLVDLNEAGLAETRGRCNPGTITRKLDVTDAEATRAIMSELVEKLGGVNQLLLSAGTSMWARFEDVTDLAVFDRLMRVNYLGAVHCVHPLLPALKAANGQITVVSSLQGELGVPGHTGYGASKHALHGFFEALDYELEGAVTTLIVKPGWITGTNLRANAFQADGTRMGESKRKHSKNSLTTATVEDTADAILAAVAKRRTELYVPEALSWVPWLKMLAPGTLAGIVKKRVAKEKK